MEIKKNRTTDSHCEFSLQIAKQNSVELYNQSTDKRWWEKLS